MFSWLSQLFETFGSLFPHLRHVKATHRAVQFAGKRVKELAPGLHWWWPITTEILDLPVVRQTLNIATQVVTTRDGSPVAASGVVVYEISDIMAALGRCYDHEETIGDVALCAVVEVLQSYDLPALREALSSGDLERRLSKVSRKRLKSFGVRVVRCALTDFAPCQVFRVIGDGDSSSPSVVPLSLG